ncbi:MAG TPA: NIPSNAP family protein [Sphingomicrobium sp.]
MNGTAADLALAAAALIGAAPEEARATELQGSFPIVELRQYTLHDGKRDVLVKLFEREFVESQEALGMKVIGTFTDIDHPDRFVWLRGFRDMDSRFSGLSSFYGGPVWQAHRDEANATMVDSDNVLLLHAPDRGAEFALPSTRPTLGADAPSGLVVATIHYLKDDPAEALPTFENQVKPALEKAGVRPLAWFAPESAANNFPRLPVREGENVLVWLAAFADVDDYAARKAAIEDAERPLASSFARPPEVLRLKPTSRSLIRGIPAADGAHDFDFLHGRWKVRHRLLKARGAGSSEWVEYHGTADTRPLLGGLCNVEEHRIKGRNSGVALRCYDRAATRWAIYWVGDGDGLLGPAVYGGFQGADGTFEGDDSYEGKPIKVRFLWRRHTADSARWEQSFSFDSGKSWETNWVMDFKRAK